MSVQKEGDKWTVRKRINGHQKKFSPKSHGFLNTQKGARLYEAKLDTELAQGTFCEPTKTTVGEYADRWFNVYVIRQTTPKTQQGHRYVIDSHIKPGLGDVSIAKLRPSQVEEFYAGLRRVDGKPGDLSANTKSIIHRTLNAILNHAVEMEVIPKNPIKSKVAPRPGPAKTSCYDLEQARRILQLSEGTPLHAALALAIHTGMRIGEICALRWEDVDFDAQAITITRSMEQTSKSIREKTTKTGRGRTIDIGEFLVRALVVHRAEQAKRRLAGDFPEHVGHVITNRNGSPHAPYFLATRWREFIRGTDLPYFSFHTLRHTHISLLIEQGEHAKTISHRAGHSTIKLTMDTYGHLMKGIGGQAVAKLDAAFGT
jgi:integrase